MFVWYLNIVCQKYAFDGKKFNIFELENLAEKMLKFCNFDFIQFVYLSSNILNQ